MLSTNLKYTDYQIVFREIPDEITLAINISGCPNHCKGCHSPELQEDVGEELNLDVILTLIQQNPGITCVCFMGGDQNPENIGRWSFCIKAFTSNLKVAWYSGKEELPIAFTNINRFELQAALLKKELLQLSNLYLYKQKLYNLCFLDYIKLGSYIEERGPLDDPNTNQKLYKVIRPLGKEVDLIDITNKFWNKNV